MLVNSFLHRNATEKQERQFLFPKVYISSSHTSVDTMWEIRANWKNKVIRYLSVLVNIGVIFTREVLLNSNAQIERGLFINFSPEKRHTRFFHNWQSMRE